MDTLDKLSILADAAKYDAACTSSGVNRAPQKGSLGMASAAGCCHSFAPDGRCITLLKVLFSNACSYDCAYCVNRRSASCERASFTPQELADLTVDFYKRNYIEGLFLSSGVVGTPDHTTELMIACLRILRVQHRFRGYIHAKIIPGTAPELIGTIGLLADRLSVNLELPSSKSLQLLCPDKDGKAVTEPMKLIHRTRVEEETSLLEATQNKTSTLAKYAPRQRALSEGRKLYGNAAAYTLRPRPRVSSAKRSFSPAGQSTQIIIGATPESDNQILRLSQALYERYDMKRVFFSAYMPMLDDKRLPAPDTPVPLRREHRLYQADWLMRYYAFTPDELVSPEAPWLDLDVDPKLAWALAHIDQFPVEIIDAPLELLLRIPGVGPVGARRIIAARRKRPLSFEDLARLNITLKRARHFMCCQGRRDRNFPLDAELIRKLVIEDARKSSYNKTRRAIEYSQPTLF
ncbi:putative DNA modification/repair radical SAM protein [Atopobium sp. oral taxon 199]|uniref:putative DNA modification/repair radical SAM protein n=1 Tax=Atopobium sp. oral taxon 199 TaxID=712156 RepID=UPI00034EBF23|nr:putative DNA modification/repair radical SAM protein [Atopobium sp. oral taxon 199]EPD77824.1 hypothetical protein HMPREF1527_00122 [Atopobium sp. oral taxon 199 str. F0494]